MKRFLEPVYLNEKMVLNCAAYLQKGVTLESEVTEKTDKTVSGKISAGIPLLQKFLSPFTLEGEAKKVMVEESKSARRYTSGGLHMAVLDELKSQDMLFSSDDVNSLIASQASYVAISAVLRPIDFYAIMGTIKSLTPLAGQIFRDFGDKFLQQQKQQKFQKLHSLADKYEKSIISLIEQLEKDYLTSKQLEMVMWSKAKGGKPLGIVDLDMSDYEPAEIKAKLTGGKFHVIGKIVSKVEDGESLNLMQRSVLSSAVEIVNKLVELTGENNQEAIQNYQVSLSKIRDVIEKFCLLEIEGPAVRIAAMSVCV